MLIDYNKITYAIDYYSKLGYKLIEVPWLVSSHATNATRPPDCKSIKCGKFGELVGSGEQSFIEMMISGDLPIGKYQTVTPCFRDDVLDETHHRHFLKLELIQYTGDILPKSKDYDYLISDALGYFQSYNMSVYLSETMENMPEISHDIMLKLFNHNAYELGSYGIRHYNYNDIEHNWIYGTGVAEPRLSYVLNLIDKGYHKRDIPKDEIGTINKIKEEVTELIDSVEQNNPIMALNEMSDIIGAIEEYLLNTYSNITLNDIITMSNVTKQAFKSGKRR